MHRAARGRRWVVVVAATGSLATVGILLPIWVRPASAAPVVPPGVQLTLYEQLGDGVEHWAMSDGQPDQQVHVARVAATAVPRLRTVLSHDTVAPTGGGETTTAMCRRLHCVVAVNGDFTDPATGEPVGTVVSGGRLLRTTSMAHAHLMIDGSGRPSVSHDLAWQASLAPSFGSSISLSGVNRRTAPHEIVLITPRYGAPTPRDQDALELVLQQVAPPPGAPAGALGVRLTALRVGGGTTVGPDQMLLVGRGAGAATLDELWLQSRGEPERAVATLSVSAAGIAESIGGSPIVVQAGQATTLHHPDNFTQGRHPRTVVGWTAAGDILLVTVDGRQPGAAGMGLPEVARLLVSLGAVEAMNLDGGGSTTFVVHGGVENRPSDAAGERAVTSALVLLPPEGIGTPQARSTDVPCPPGRVPHAGFTDVGPSDVHGASVDCVVWWQLARGVTDDLYGPGRAVTRGQVASFVARLVERTEGTLPADPPDLFGDDAGSPHEAGINQLSAVGVVVGRADGTYGPDEPVSRAQMASLLVRAVEYHSGRTMAVTADYFPDDGRSAHQAAINKAAGAGITGGTGNGDYRPGAAVRRDQMASFLTRALDVLVVGA